MNKHRLHHGEAFMHCTLLSTLLQWRHISHQADAYIWYSTGSSLLYLAWKWRLGFYHS